MFCKGLISKIYKEFIEVNSKQKNQLHLEKGKGLNRHFFPKKKYRWQTGTENDALHL